MTLMKVLLLCTLLLFCCTSPGVALESEEDEVSQSEDESESAENSNKEASQKEDTEEKSTNQDDVHRVHSIVDKLLGDTDDIEEQKKNVSVTKQVKALQNNMKGLQKSLDDFVKTQEAGENKARKLYRKIHNAFSESFGEDIFKSPEELANQDGTKKSSAKPKSRKRWRSHRPRQQVYTVKQRSSAWGGYPMRSYGAQSSSYSYPVRAYGSQGKTVKTMSYVPSSYPVKSYGTQFQTANSGYSVQSYGDPENKFVYHPRGRGTVKKTKANTVKKTK